MFTLIGSRARGTFNENSDWDVIVTLDPVPQFSDEVWISVCAQIWRTLDPYLIKKEAIEWLRKEHGYIDGHVDVFLEIEWRGEWEAVLLEPDFVSGAFDGWLTDRERAFSGVPRGS